jgi:two-component system nitrogen regulation response regulator NtrX
MKSYSEATSAIMMSGEGTLDRVVASMRLGAETFLQKPFDYSALLGALEQVSRMIATRRELAALKRESRDLGERLPGISPAVVQLNELLPQIARAPSPVLIEGESGTGKGVFARLIHNRSPRVRGPFVDLSCAGLSRELLESELFGHERGAFTTAVSTKPGLFEIAADGTMFLDEIGEMDLAVQARLLKAVEEKRFRRVGGVRDIRADFRLVAATNRELQADVANGRFRSDLYYRLNVVRIRMPPLRERLEDVPILAEEMLKTLAKEVGRPLPRISPRALKKLASYPWPGNVRELRNLVQRLLILGGTEDITLEEIEREISTQSTHAEPLVKQDLLAMPLREAREHFERAYLQQQLLLCNGKVGQLAKRVGMERTHLYRKLRSLGVDFRNLGED